MVPRLPGYCVGHPKLPEVLDTGVHRWRETGTFRQWEITTGAGAFDDAVLFRQVRRQALTKQVSKRLSVSSM